MEVVPFPKSHFQEEGFPLEESENCTTSGAHPDVELEIKLALNCPFTVKDVMNKSKNKTKEAGVFTRIECMK